MPTVIVFNLMNPYASPSNESEVVTGTAPPNAELGIGQIAKPIFIAWEKLRIVYVVILGLFTLLLTGPNAIKPSIAMSILAGGLIANLCYFAGPCAETYIRWLGYRGKVLRWMLFISGTLFTMVLAVMELGNLLLPDQP